MTRIVPQPDHRLSFVMLIAEDAQGRDREEQVAGERDFQSAPAGSEDAQEMGAGKEQYIAIQRPQPGNDAVCARTDLRWALAARAAVAKDLQSGRSLRISTVFRPS
jgi:hypothetical protein